MILEIDDDFSDQIVVTVLADSYVSMQSMLKNGSVWHEDDVAAYEELMPALKIVGGWFSLDFNAEIKKANKRMNKK
jgi:hypothetical protein